MAEAMTREQFRTAVADAVNGVLNVYREVDGMLRELGTALADEEPRFVPLVKRLFPSVSRKNPDARWLRSYQASVFAPADVATEAEEDDEEEDEEEDDDLDTDATSALTLRIGSGLVLARANIYDRNKAGFEPTLAISTLLRCRLDASLPTGTQLKISRARIKKLFRALDAHEGTGAMHTNVWAHPVGQPKARHKMIFDVPLGTTTPLFDVSPASLLELAARVRSDWNSATQ